MKQHAHMFFSFSLFSTGVLSQNIPFGPVLFASKMPPAPPPTRVSVNGQNLNFPALGLKLWEVRNAGLMWTFKFFYTIEST